MSDDRKPKLLTREELLAALMDIGYTLGHGTPADERAFVLGGAKRFAERALTGPSLGESAKGIGMGCCSVISALIEGPHCPLHLRTEEWARDIARDGLPPMGDRFSPPMGS